jgi:hypothetical protein
MPFVRFSPATLPAAKTAYAVFLFGGRQRHLPKNVRRNMVKILIKINIDIIIIIK